MKLFKTRKLQAENDRLTKLLNIRDKQIARRGEQILTQAKTISAQAQKLTAIAEELRTLRNDIARAEQQQTVGIHPNLRAATGPGMARAANQAKPWQDADFIAEDAKHVRREDGAGDPE